MIQGQVDFQSSSFWCQPGAPHARRPDPRGDPRAQRLKRLGLSPGQENPMELRRQWIPQGPNPYQGSYVLLAGPTFITRMPFFSKNAKAETVGRRPVEAHCMTFAIVSEPGISRGVRTRSAHLPDVSFEIERPNFTGRRRLQG